MSLQSKGTLITLIAAISWGISGVSGQYLLDNGINVYLLTSLRLIIAGFTLLIMIAYKDFEKLKKLLADRKTIIQIILFSLIGLVLNQLSYLKAIYYTNAGTATVLQYLTPIIVVIIMSLKTRKLPTKSELMAISLAVFGTVIIATHGDFTQLSVTPIGLFWGILAAFSYAAYIILPTKLIGEWGSLLVLGIGMVTGGFIFTLSTQSWGYPITLSMNNILAFFGIIGIGTIVAYSLFLKGVSLIGPVKGSLLASVEPIAAVFFTLIILKETFYLIDFLGIFCILLAVVTISIKDLIKPTKK